MNDKMLYVIPRGWYTYDYLGGYKFVPSKENQDLVVCSTCKLHNFDVSISCLTCKINN